MPAHRIDAYKDGYKWILFCVKCGQEEPFESQENCSERFIVNSVSSRLTTAKEANK